ncbi:MAG: hydrogenase maturation nickel metallochaperone HypA [Myxococcota bacterium]
MHELSLSEALLDQIDDVVRARPHGRDGRVAVRLVRMRVGALAGLEPELFRTAFETTRALRGHGAAELELVFEPALWRCRGCGEALAEGADLRCACGGEARLERGGDLVLERLELEEPDV